MKGLAFLLVLLLIVPSMLPVTGSGEAGKDAAGRAAGAPIEWVSPVPTGSSLYGMAWNEGSDGAIIVGQAGTVLKYRPFSTQKFVAFQPTLSQALYAVAYQPGGNLALIVGASGAVMKFDGTTFTPIGSGTNAALNDVAWKPDGSGAVIAGDDGTVLVYDGTAITKLPALTGYDFHAAAWAPGADSAVMVGEKGISCSCNLTASGLLATGITEELYDIAYKPDGSSATAVGAKGVVLSLKGQNFTVAGDAAYPIFYCVAWNEDGSQAMLVGYDNNTHGSAVYKLDQSGLQQINNNMTSYLMAVLWEPDSPIALIIGLGGLVAEYGSNAFTTFSSGIPNEMGGAAWKADGSYALVVGSDGYVARFDGSNLTRIPSNSVEDLKAVAWHPGEDYALICGYANAVLRYNASNSSIERLDTGLLVNVNFTSVSWKPDGSYALMAGDYGKLVMYNGTGFTLQLVVGPYAVYYNDIAWRPDGAFALIAGVSSNLLRYEEKVLPPYFCVTKVAVPGAPPVAYFSISWRTWQGAMEAMIAGTNGVVVRFNDSGPGVQQTDSSSFYYSVACMPGSGYALVVGASGKMLLWASYGFLRPLSGTEVVLRDVSWRPDGTYALMLGQSGTVIKYTLSRPSMPQAVISWPRTASVFEPGANIFFDGSNSTPTFEQPLSFHWESNVSGSLGDGPRFSKVLGPGRHTIALFANDTSGHSSTATVTITVKAPNRAPVGRIDSPSEGQTFNNTDLVEFDAARSYDPDGDPLAFQWTSSKAGVLSTRPSFNTTLNVGAHLITLWLNDSHGYNISRTVNITVVLYNRPPAAVISSPIAEGMYTTKESIRFDATFSRDEDGDGLSYYWASNASGYLGGTSRFVRSLPAGAHRITVWVDDSRGGNVSASVNITVVKADEPPTMAIDGPVEGKTVSGPVQISGVSIDPEGAVVTVSVQIDDGDWLPANGGQSWSFSLDTTNLTNGKHVIRAKGSDGTLESPIASLNITVHNPFWGFTVVISFPVDGTAVNGKVKLMGTASRIGSAIVQVELRIDNGSWQAVTGTSSWELIWDTSKVGNGWHTIGIRANDGTDSSRETTIVLKVDNQSRAGTSLLPLVGAFILLLVVILVVAMLLVRMRKPAPQASPPPKGKDEEE